MKFFEHSVPIAVFLVGALLLLVGYGFEFASTLTGRITEEELLATVQQVGFILMVSALILYLIVAFLEAVFWKKR
jgi:hypothetical protein